MDLLRDCVIRDSYSVPDAINSALILTDSGSDVKSRLIRKEQVSARDAHLMCALALGHDDLFVDVENSDVGQLIESISAQIISRDIRFPFIYGRQLYDAFADTFDEAKHHMTNEETVRLLELLPHGVFQYGRFVVGPSGLSTTKFRRTLRSSAQVPAYHCDDPVCRELHAVILTTGHNASINAERAKLEKMLKASAAAPADWPGLASEISRVEDSYFGNSWAAPMVTLIGDCLGEDELKKLHQYLSRVQELSPYESREKLLEVLLISFDDTTICEAMDALVRAGHIEVPDGEVRKPVSTEHLRSGAFRLQPQLGGNGVRFVSGDPGLPMLRERDLFRRIYLDAGEAERHELDWQLRGIDGVSIEVRLDEYLRTVAPPDALARLVLSGSTSAISASELAGAGDFDGATDSQIIRRLLWKLGFDDREPEDLHVSFWRNQEKLSAAVQSWLGTGPGDADDFKGMASVYFSELEGRLEDSLAFAAWALLFDHTSSSRPFSYDPEVDRSVGLKILDRFYKSEGAGKAGETLRFTNRLTIFPLIRGFGVLSNVLASILGKRSEYQRPRKDFPAFANSAALQTFPFQSTLPFLDVSEHSQSRIIDGLSQVETALNGVDVAKVRNEYSHYRRTSPEVAEMVTTLEVVGQAVRTIENLGFGLNLFSPAGESTDQWGRQFITFVGPRSLEHGISRPSSLQWAGLPGLRENQFLVRSAAFDDANEVLRFVRGYSSQFSEMWANYPRPRRSMNRMADGLTSAASS